MLPVNIATDDEGRVVFRTGDHTSLSALSAKEGGRRSGRLQRCVVFRLVRARHLGSPGRSRMPPMLAASASADERFSRGRRGGVTGGLPGPPITISGRRVGRV